MAPLGYEDEVQSQERGLKNSSRPSPFALTPLPRRTVSHHVSVILSRPGCRLALLPGPHGLLSWPLADLFLGLHFEATSQQVPFLPVVDDSRVRSLGPCACQV